jgi:hypothetical protein
MSDQYVVCRPPGCRLRLDVGSSKASWRQPTCREGAGYNMVRTAKRGTPYGIRTGPEIPGRLFFVQTLFFSFISVAGVNINTDFPLHNAKNSCIIAW